MNEEREEKNPGPPPDREEIEALLRERYPMKKGDKLTVTAERDPKPSLLLFLESGKDLYTIGVEYVRGANGRDVWMLVADALDALFGTFIESGRAYRDLPAGDDVEYEGAVFNVTVERTIPELAKQADRLLDEDEGSTPRRS